MQFFRVREKAMKMAEMLTGSRKTYGVNLIGGVRRDILKEQVDLDHLGARRVASAKSPICRHAARHAQFGRPGDHRMSGALEPFEGGALTFSPVGPAVRGSGFPGILVSIHAYAAYNRVPWRRGFNVQHGCDILSRTSVHTEKSSTVMISDREVALDDMPAGPILTEGFRIRTLKFALGLWRLRAARIFTGACWAITRRFIAGSAAPPATTTGPRFVICCAAIPFPSAPHCCQY